MENNSVNERGEKGRAKLARNVIFSGATSFAEFFLLLLLIAAGRFLGAEQFGTFSVALAATTILVFSTNLGLDALIIRYIAIDKKAAVHTIGSILTWKLMLASLCTVVFLLVVSIVVTDELTLSLIYILTPAALLRSFNMSFRSYYQGFERFKIEAVIVLVDRGLIFLLGVLLLWLNGSAVQLAWVFVVVRSTTLLILLIVFRYKVCHFNLVLDFRYAKDFQIEAIPLGLVAVVVGLNAQIDVLMLSYYETREEIGMFSSAHKVYEGCLAACLILNPALYPRLSKLFVNDIDRHRELVIRALKYYLMVGMPLAAVGLLFSEPLIITLFGSSYAPTANTLSIMLVGAALYLLVAGTQNALFSIGQQKQVLLIMSVGLLAKFVINLILIPAYGKEGAAISLAIAAVVMVIVSVKLLLKHHYELPNLLFTTGKILLATLTGMVCVYFLSFDFYIGLAMFVGIYIFCVLTLQVFDNFEVEIMRNLMSKLKFRQSKR